MKRKFIFLLSWLISLYSYSQNGNSLSLSGNWLFQMDTLENGISEKWYLKELMETITLPGSMSENNKGFVPTVKTKWTGSIYDSSWYFNPAMAKYRDPGNTKFPFWLTPVKYYVGPAWYQKAIVIPETWKDKRIVLFLERPHWQSTLWIDGLMVGSQNSLSTPHIFELPSEASKPGKHIITIRIDNSIKDVDPGINSHSLTDHTQGNWNGIAGRIELIAGSKTHLDSVKLVPDLKDKLVHVSMTIKGYENIKNGKISINVRSASDVKDNITPIKIDIKNPSPSIRIDFPMSGNFKTWDEFNPNLYEMEICLEDENSMIDSKIIPFGMREFTISGSRFQINNRTVFLRGTVECSVFPLTGYPPVAEQDWAKVFKICRSYGLNHMRFHSYCPPEAAFAAADKAGFYLQVEGPSWAKYSTSLGKGKPIDKYVYDETERILNAYGNHPSFCMMAYGNEPSGNYVPYLNEWLKHFKKKDPQRVYCGASTGRSWSIMENSDYIVRSGPRGLDWKDIQPGNSFDYSNKMESQKRPYITHEMGQWCAFPNFREIEKYKGPLKAKNFELFEEELNKNYMGDLAHDFLMASGKLQLSCYKQEIEATLRTPGLAGFQLLGLNDFPGQGTALVGVLDAFWDEKGYAAPGEFKSFCNALVPLVRLPKFTFTKDEILSFTIEVANFTDSTIETADVSWQIKNSKGKVIYSKNLLALKLPIGNCQLADTNKFDLKEVIQAEKFNLEVSVNGLSNSWNFWVYPSELPELNTSKIYVCDTLDKDAQYLLMQGGKVLLLAAGKVQNGKDVVQYLTPVFWNTSWFKMRPPHTTGILINNTHPALENFPTDYYSDLQWWEVANRQQVMNLENFPPGFRPVIEPIDTWFLNRRLAMLFEAKVDNGKLMVCSIDLQNDLKSRPVARQLLYSIEDYMISDNFNPVNTIALDTVQELFEVKERNTWNPYAGETP